MQNTLQQIHFYFCWRKILYLRRKGSRRLHRGYPLLDPKLQRWSAQLTALGLQVKVLEQQLYPASH